MHACSLREQGKLREAVDEFTGLAKETADPVDRAGILWSAATTSMALRDFDLAREQLKEIRALVPTLDNASASDPDDRPLSLLIGVVTEEADLCYVDGRLGEALDKLNSLFDKHGEALHTFPFRDGYRYAQLMRAYLLTDLGNWKEALPILAEAQSFQGPQAQNLVNFYLGHCYVCAGDYVRAKPRLIEAVRLGLPPNLEYRAHNALGIAYFGLGEYAQAKPEFEKTAEIADPAYLNDSQVWKRLEATCRQLGLNDEANHYAKLTRAGGAHPGFFRALWRRLSV